MYKSRFSEPQAIRVPKEIWDGRTVVEASRKHSIPDASYFN